MANIGHAVNSSLYRSLPFDAVWDFSPIILVATQPSLLVSNPAFAAKTVGELIDLAKARTNRCLQRLGRSYLNDQIALKKYLCCACSTSLSRRR